LTGTPLICEGLFGPSSLYWDLLFYMDSPILLYHGYNWLATAYWVLSKCGVHLIGEDFNSWLQ